MSPFRSAQAGSSITWLFALIAGGTLLVVFYQIATMQLDSASNIQESQRLDRLSNIIQALQSTPETNRSIPALRQSYNVVCRNDNIHLTTPDQTATQELTQHPLFTPSELPDNSLDFVTVSYDAPIPITTLLYVFPTTKTIPGSNTQTFPEPLQPHVNTSTRNSDYTDPELQAGEFLTSSTMLNCTINKVRSRARLSYETTRSKATKLIDTTPDRCNDVYRAANTTLTDLKAIMNDAQHFKHPGFEDNVSALQRQNEALRADSCPTLY
jgi:hypothetical protein